MNERKALFKGLLSSLVLHGSIKTTEQKAKSIKGEADKLITKVKKQGQNAKRSLAISLTEEAIKKLIKDIAPLFSNRNGGYTRVIRLGRRVTDSAPMAVIEWVEGYENQRSKIPLRLSEASRDQKLETKEEKKENKK